MAGVDKETVLAIADSWPVTTTYFLARSKQVATIFKAEIGKAQIPPSQLPKGRVSCSCEDGTAIQGRFWYFGGKTGDTDLLAESGLEVAIAGPGQFQRPQPPSATTMNDVYCCIWTQWLDSSFSQNFSVLLTFQIQYGAEYCTVG
jgi:hypothetical protein